MHVKAKCKHFTWKKSQFIDMDKVDQNILIEPNCDIDKLTRLLNCPENCRWFEK